MCLHYEDQLVNALEEVIAVHSVGNMQSYWTLK